ncbi:MAG: M56 family metallopeptidase, partial [Hungatella hathewayi]|nr:M56 family metallopeptidase [Hungatella hathewayi]
VKYIRAGSEEAGDIDLLERFGKLVEKSRVKNTVEFCTNSLISSPLLIGFFHPCIVLPTADLSSSDFEYTILHELTHYKRRDMFYKWLIQLIVCVHWFNPLVYLMRREIDRACELSCDEAVIKTLDPGGRKAYGDTLLHAMGAGGRYRDSLASVTLNESRELLKERLDAIMRFKRTTRLTAAVSAALVLVLSFTAAVTGAYAASPDAENTVVINLSNEGQHSVIHSSSFEAKDGQILTLKITSSIKGAADLFLFSPSNQEQRIPIGGNSETKTIPLSEGRWSYNCTGFFDSGNISIVGTLSSAQSAAAGAAGDAPSGLTVTDPDPNDMIVIDLSDEGQKCIVHSSGFEAKDGQIL